MQRRMLSILVGIALVGVMAATGAWAQNVHFVGTPVCLVSSNDCDTLRCTGKVAGVGNEPVCVFVEAAGGCVNNPGHEPAGHAQSVPELEEPHGGRINFDVSINLDCPPGLTPIFGPTGTTATLFIVQDADVNCATLTAESVPAGTVSLSIPIINQCPVE
jgi:hypothetical protein